MAIHAQCSCGKSISVADALAGKTIRCPACGKGIALGAPTPAAVAKQTIAKKKLTGVGAAPVVYISIGKILTFIVLAIVVTLGILFAIGPMRVWNQWEVIGPKASDDVKDVISFALQAEMSQQGMYNPSKAEHEPVVEGDVLFYRPLLTMSMPDQVRFEGKSNEGPFIGTYNPHNGEIDADVAYGGYSFAGLVDITKAPYHFHMTGREVNKQISAESNGQSLQIVYPPVDKNNP
jgi:hypothetical protein